MDGDTRGDRLRSFLLGSVVGASAAVAAARRARGPRRRAATGLAAFEDAPCHREARAREQPAGRRGRSAP